jgi:hypothetical protein
MITYTLSKGNTYIAPGKYVARVVPIATMDLEGLIERMMQTSTVAKPDVVGVLEGFFSAIQEVLLLGMNVDTPLANFRTSVRGTFDSDADGYDPERHEITAQVSAGARLRRAIREHARVEQDVLPRPIPIVTGYYDVASDTTSQVLTPGNMGRVRGKLLTFDPTDAAQGVFFRAADGTETRTDAYAWVGIRKVILLVPTLAAGAYTLVLRASFNDSGDVREGVLLEQLTVA